VTDHRPLLHKSSPYSQRTASNWYSACSFAGRVERSRRLW
jgi:hypothetical protein